MKERNKINKTLLRQFKGDEELVDSDDEEESKA